MDVQVHASGLVEADGVQAGEVERAVRTGLGHVVDRLTQVTVRLGDESGSRRGGGDVRCVVEASPAGHQPVAVTEHAQSVTAAVAGAVTKLRHLLDHEFGRARDRDGRATIRDGGPQ